jgi:hypothetical protein
MRYLLTILVLFTVTILGISPICAKAPATRQPNGVVVPCAGESMLRMVHIRAASSGSLKQLRAMPIDIVRVRPDPERPADKNSLAGGVIVEAVVPKDLLPKLKAMGFEVSEFPQNHK